MSIRTPGSGPDEKVAATTEREEPVVWIVLTEDENLRPDEVWGPFESMEDAEEFAARADGMASFWRLRAPEPVAA